jgi:hypothetical protein
LGVEATPIQHLGEARCLFSPPLPLLPPFPIPPLPSPRLPRPHRLAPGPWAWRLLRSPHLRRSPMPASLLPFLFPSPLLPSLQPPRLRSRTLGVEVSESTPRRSPMPLLPPFLSSSPSPPPSLPTLGVELLRNPHLGEARCPSLPPPFSLLALPPPRLALPDLRAWRLLRSPHLGEAPCLFSPPPFLPPPLASRPQPLASLPDLGRGGCSESHT